MLLGNHLLEIHAHLGHGLIHRAVDAEIDEVIKKMRSGEELHGEIADEAGGLFQVRVNGVGPAREQAITNRIREGHIYIGGAGDALKGSLSVKEILEEGTLQAPNAQAGAIVVCQECSLGIFVLWHLRNEHARSSFNHKSFSAS